MHSCCSGLASSQSFGLPAFDGMTENAADSLASVLASASQLVTDQVSAWLRSNNLDADHPGAPQQSCPLHVCPVQLQNFHSQVHRCGVSPFRICFFTKILRLIDTFFLTCPDSAGIPPS